MSKKGIEEIKKIYENLPKNNTISEVNIKKDLNEIMNSKEVISPSKTSKSPMRNEPKTELDIIRNNILKKKNIKSEKIEDNDNNNNKNNVKEGQTELDKIRNFIINKKSNLKKKSMDNTNNNKKEVHYFEQLTQLKTPNPLNNNNNNSKSNKMEIDKKLEKRQKSYTMSMNNNFDNHQNKNIHENENKVFEKSFDRLLNLQILLKKESSLKELCKNIKLKLFYLFLN